MVGSRVGPDEEVTLLETVGRIYDSALDPALLPSVLEEVMIACGAIGGSLHEPHANAFTPQKITTPGLTDFYADYDRKEFWRIESRVRKIRTQASTPGSAYQAIRRGSIVTDLSFFSPDECQKDEYYQDILRPFDLGYGAYFWTPLPGKDVVFAASRALRDGPFEKRDLERMQLLRGHLERAMRIAFDLRVSRSASHDLLSMLSGIDVAAILLDPNGIVLFANLTAQEMDGVVISLKRRHLAATTVQDRAALDKLVHSALNPSPNSEELSPIRLRGLGGEIVIAQAVPAPTMQNGASLLDAPPGAIIVLTDPGSRAHADPEKSLRVLGLTPAEARIAYWAGQGLGAVDIGAKVNNTPGTVRVTLKRIYSKLNVRRQSELALLVAKLSSFSGLRRDDANSKAIG